MSYHPLSPEIYHLVERRMLGHDHANAFSRQINNAYEKGADAFLLTAYSAIPLADAIRGFYDGKEEDTPHIDYILVPPAPCHIIKSRMGFRRKYRHEQSRLENTLPADAENVFVVDEWTETGQTIARSLDLLKLAGIRSPQAIKGRWYTQARKRDIDLVSLTSIHAEAMHDIGRKSCLLVEESNKPLIATPEPPRAR